MNGAEVAAAVARFAQILGMISAFGALGFRLLVLPGVGRDEALVAEMAARLGLLAQASLAFALLGGLARLGWQAAVVGDVGGGEAGSVSALVAAAADMVALTRFGQFLALQWLALALALVLSPGRGRPAACAALAGLTLALVLTAGSGHGAAMPGWRGAVLGMVASLHVLAAGVWLGGLAPLSLLLRRLPAPAAAAAVARFSALATIAVAVLALSALAQGAALIGGLAALAASPYGRLILVKTLLFLTLLGFGARNRLLLLPALAGANGPIALRALRRGLGWAMALALAVLLAASFLGSLAPGQDFRGGDTLAAS